MTQSGRATRTSERSGQPRISSSIGAGWVCILASICTCVCGNRTPCMRLALIHTVRDTIGTGIYFVTYESVKQILSNVRGTPPTSPLAVVVAGGMCGLVSWACVSFARPSQRNLLMRFTDISNRHRQEHLPAQLPCWWEGESRETEDTLLQCANVSGYGIHDFRSSTLS
jgi:hypothetical protein